MNRALLLLLLAFPVPGRAGPPSADDAKSAQTLFLKATLLERQGSYAEAMESFEAALKADPDSAYIYREAADLALEMGSVDKADIFTRRAVALDPREPSGRILEGRVHWAQGDSKAAQASFEAALKADPKSVESLLSLGAILAAKSPEKARELLLGFLKENPTHEADIRLQLAKIALESGRMDVAEKELAGAVDAGAEGDAAPVRYALAHAYEVEHATESALTHYSEISKLDPRNAALLIHIGQLEALLGRWDEARARFLEARAIAPTDPSVNHWLALEAERRGEYNQAADYLAPSAAVVDDPGLSLRLGYYLTQANRLKEAVEVLERAHARWPKSDQVSYFLALGYQDLKKNKKAIATLRDLLEVKPDYRDARYQLAVLLEHEGDINGAEKEFRTLLVRKPDDAQILNYLGYSLADRGLKLGEAELMIKEALRLEPRNGAYQDSLGWVHHKQGRSSEAVTELLAALNLMPEDESVWDHLGDAYRAAGNAPSAWFCWKKADSLTPSGKSSGKAAAIEEKFKPEDRGRLFLEYLRAAQSGYKKLAALCEVRGQVKGRAFAYAGMLNFRAPDDFVLELLGPLYTPMFRMRMNAQGFVMDPLKLEGVTREELLAAGHAAAITMQSYFSGGILSREPARLHRGWRKSELLVPGWRLALDKEEIMITGVKSEDKVAAPLAVGDFARIQGRRVPGLLRIEGPGFLLEIKMKSINAEFLAPPPSQESATRNPR